MVFFPIVAALVALAFAVVLFRRFAKTKGIPQMSWGIAMAMYALASLAVAAGVSGGWDKTLFKAYWLFGAMLNVPLLALGSVALLRKPVVTWSALFAVAVATIYGIGVVLGTDVDTLPITAEPYQIPRGRDVWAGATAGKLGSIYSIPAYIIVVAIAIVSGRREDVPVQRVRANWLIAGGTTIVALGGFILARIARGAFFSIFLALGITVMFVGFVMASGPARPGASASRPEPPAPS